MTLATQYFTSSVSGNVTTPANAQGAPDATYTTDTGDTDWTHRWQFDALLGDTITGDLTITVRVRRNSADGNNPTVNSITVRQGGTTVHTAGSTIPNTDGSATDIVLTVAKSGLVDFTALSVELVTTGSGSGGPTTRRSVQVDAATLTYDYIILTGTILKHWTGSLWKDGVMRRYVGAVWEQVQLKRFNGSTWELI